MDNDDAGLLWVTTQGGRLICVDPEHTAITRVVTVAEGLPSALLYSCSSDGQGHLWLGTRHGVAR
jgi:ligand-binding sensor domain-containing protein